MVNEYAPAKIHGPAFRLKAQDPANRIADPDKIVASLKDRSE
jgi:hypothetical protein